jgi:hypothetical protein
MSPERIKDILARQPFEPFALVTGDGESVPVLSREFAFLKPGGRTLEVSTPKFRGASQEGDFEEHQIDVFLITKVITPVRRRPAKGNGRTRRR